MESGKTYQIKSNNPSCVNMCLDASKLSTGGSVASIGTFPCFGLTPCTGGTFSTYMNQKQVFRALEGKNDYQLLQSTYDTTKCIDTAGSVNNINNWYLNNCDKNNTNANLNIKKSSIQSKGNRCLDSSINTMSSTCDEPSPSKNWTYINIDTAVPTIGDVVQIKSNAGGAYNNRCLDASYIQNATHTSVSTQDGANTGFGMTTCNSGNPNQLWQIMKGDTSATGDIKNRMFRNIGINKCFDAGGTVNSQPNWYLQNCDGNNPNQSKLLTIDDHEKMIRFNNGTNKCLDISLNTLNSGCSEGNIYQQFTFVKSNVYSTNLKQRVNNMTMLKNINNNKSQCLNTDDAAGWTLQNCDVTNTKQTVKTLPRPETKFQIKGGNKCMDIGNDKLSWDCPNLTASNTDAKNAVFEFTKTPLSIGTIVTSSPSTSGWISIPSGVDVRRTIGYITIPAGSWIIDCGIRVTGTSITTTGIYISENANVRNVITCIVNSYNSITGSIDLRLTYAIKTTSKKTVYYGVSVETSFFDYTTNTNVNYDSDNRFTYITAVLVSDVISNTASSTTLTTGTSANIGSLSNLPPDPAIIISGVRLTIPSSSNATITKISDSISSSVSWVNNNYNSSALPSLVKYYNTDIDTYNMTLLRSVGTSITNTVTVDYTGSLNLSNEVRFTYCMLVKIPNLNYIEKFYSSTSEISGATSFLNMTIGKGTWIFMANVRFTCVATTTVTSIGMNIGPNSDCTSIWTGYSRACNFTMTANTTTQDMFLYHVRKNTVINQNVYVCMGITAGGNFKISTDNNYTSFKAIKIA
jgi:hypothetical protein